MRLKGIILAALFSVFVLTVGAQAQQTEQEIVNKYLSKLEKKHASKLGWAAVHFSYNRINRFNDYNKFTNYTSQQLVGTRLSWLDGAKAFGAEFGMVFKKRFAWSFGGEYWMKIGETLTGTYTYQPPLGTAVSITDAESEISVYGVYTGVQFYLLNPPSPEKSLDRLSVKAITTIGYYGVSWDLWSQYENLNLSTSLPEANNVSYKGSAPGVSIGLGADYPLNVLGLAMGAEVQYLYLNFKNVAWYNDQEQEIVASYTGDADGRVNLGLSGFRAKIELKRFFTW